MKKFLPALFAFLLLLSSCGKAPAPAEEETLSVFTSENGYEISYPADITPASLSSDIDFVVMDETTGSSVTVLTEKNDNAGDITEQLIREEKLREGMEIKITSFEQKTEGDIPAYEVTYKYNENTVTEIIYLASEHIYRATYTELPGTPDKIRDEMTAIISSLKEA